MTDSQTSPAQTSAKASSIQPSAADFIAQVVRTNPVVLFMKGVPEQPKCGFSALVVQILDHLDVEFVGVDVLRDEALRQGVKTYTDWPTVPQLYVNGEFVGGSDIVREMFQSGELKPLLAEQGVLPRA